MRRLSQVAVVLMVAGTTLGVVGGFLEGNAWFGAGAFLLFAGILFLGIGYVRKAPPIEEFIVDGPSDDEEPPIDIPQSEHVLRSRDRGTIQEPWLKT